MYEFSYSLSRSEGSSCGLWMVSCLISALFTTAFLVFAIRRSLRCLFKFQGLYSGIPGFYSLWKWSYYHKTSLSCIFNLFRLDVLLQRRFEATTIAFQIMDAVCTYTQLIKHIWLKVFTWKTNALFLSRGFAFSSGTFNQGDLAKVFNV